MTVAATPTWLSTFHPDSRAKDRDELRAVHLAQRADIAVGSIMSCERINRATQLGSLGEPLLNLFARPASGNALVFDDPVFAIWLRFLHRALANEQTEEILRHAAALPALLERLEKRLTGKEREYVPGSAIPVQQLDLDPYLMAATPPSYDFVAAGKTPEPRPHGHPVAMQADLLGIALSEIGETWPELKAQVLEFVKIIGYLPDATFRSCSAARYSGVVYFGNMDESVLDLEESLVHETGHQVLYRLGEVTSLTKPGTPVEASYILPWSGAKRDLFGYLHAFYIYLLLAKYYWRRAVRGNRAEECRRRAVLITMGCTIARPELETDPNLSEQGQRLMQALGDDLDALHDQMRN